MPYTVLSRGIMRKKTFKFCKENLAKFNSTKWRICDIIVADESWIYFRAIWHKLLNMAWVGEGESPPGVQNATGTSLNRCQEFSDQHLWYFSTARKVGTSSQQNTIVFTA